LPEKTTNSFFTCQTRFFFFVCARKKTVSLLLGFKQEKHNTNFFYLFLLFLFASPTMTIDDEWVGAMASTI